MSGISLVYAVYGEEAQARAAAEMAIAERLAACANILPRCTSVFRWEGVVQGAEEIPVLFKTSTTRRDALIAALAEQHDYDVPAIVGWDAANVPASFASWVTQEMTSPE